MLVTIGPNQAYEQPRKGVARRYTYPGGEAAEVCQSGAAG